MHDRLFTSFFVSFRLLTTVMKRILWLVPLCFILYACPFESPVALEKKPVEPVDTALYGYWYGIIKDFSDMFGIEALDLTKETDSTYKIIRYGKAIKGNMILPDTAYFTGFTSYIDSQRYMNIVADVLILEWNRKSKREVARKQRVYYMAAIDLKNDTLRVRTVGEDFSVRKTYSSSEELKEYMTDLIARNVNIYDSTYSLSYRKIPRPQPVKGF